MHAFENVEPPLRRRNECEMDYNEEEPDKSKSKIDKENEQSIFRYECCLNIHADCLVKHTVRCCWLFRISARCLTSMLDLLFLMVRVYRYGSRFRLYQDVVHSAQP
ncbi:hypothetical protein L1987_09814 [Smallanthus sonchifolius]|uniref:Uncharacterized protein n=1 Tax=Smallanthus sonchifolius TaxID=185202 RepID=A0ACB9JQJ4_9ASTR|nr:hypothetical protein L1987_09814 [Smallanthus sonchifolius]